MCGFGGRRHLQMGWAGSSGAAAGRLQPSPAHSYEDSVNAFSGDDRLAFLLEYQGRILPVKDDRRSAG